MKTRRYFYLIGIFLLIIILLVLIFKNMTRNSRNGNNINSQEIVDYVLNINSYKAQITVQVNSNKNTNLNLSKMLTNYRGLEENSLDLCNFIQDYKSSNESSFEEKDNEIIMTTTSYSKYNKTKVLYIDKEHIVPTRLLIKDDNQNTTIIIEYNDIELN